MSATTEKEVAASAGESHRVDLPVTGMTCAACARRIERKLTKTPGVNAANVNFATQRATIEYDPARTGVRQFASAVEEIGYRVIDVTAADGGASAGRVEEEARRAGRRDLARRFAVAAALSLPVLVISMSHGAVALFNVPWINYLQLALTAPVVFYSGAPFYRGAWAALRHRAADMNTLIATGTGAAFVYSVVATLAPRLVAGAGGAAGMNDMTTGGAAGTGALAAGDSLGAAAPMHRAVKRLGVVSPSACAPSSRPGGWPATLTGSAGTSSAKWSRKKRDP